MTTPAPICPYCQQPAKLVDSAIVYGGRSYGPIWDCRPCDAYVGVHRNSPNHAPLGRLANMELRTWKMRAHRVFDPVWKAKKMKRREAYSLLAGLLGIPKTQAHIGMFDVAQCQRVVQLLSQHGVTNENSSVPRGELQAS